VVKVVAVMAVVVATPGVAAMQVVAAAARVDTPSSFGAP